ncbi:hypothetical protein H0E82_03815 [Luteimonas sp. SJ-16]|uniref:Uncharacterized protein n=1 Tax=Luteimonas deserti TaxID=2752306 RepID=A0A7Z0TV53_9GAMM|nr:hypothetical protein [Luteimonas deserti]
MGVAAPAFGGDDQTPPDVDPAEGLVAAAGEQPDERIVCRIERPIGSKLSRRVCRTAASIEEVREITVSGLRNTQTNAFKEP